MASFERYYSKGIESTPTIVHTSNASDSAQADIVIGMLLSNSGLVASTASAYINGAGTTKVYLCRDLSIPVGGSDRTTGLHTRRALVEIGLHVHVRTRAHRLFEDKVGQRRAARVQQREAPSRGRVHVARGRRGCNAGRAARAVRHETILPR